MLENILSPKNKKDIKTIQDLINLQGLKVPVDGKWGQVTQQAVSELKKNSDKFNNLKLKNTKDQPQWLRNLSELIVQLDSSSTNKYPDVTKWIQQRLAEMGYPVGKSGCFDTKTQDAIKQIQEKLGKKVTGAIAPYVDDTWQALIDGKEIYLPRVSRGNIDQNDLAQEARRLFVKSFKKETLGTDDNFGEVKVDVWINNHTAPKRLSMGSRGADVRKLQQMLNDADYGPIAVDGIWGQETDQAVGQHLEYYNALCLNGRLTPVPNPVEPDPGAVIRLSMGSRGTDVRKLQQMLNDADYGPIAVDGIWGQETDQAVGQHLGYYNSLCLNGGLAPAPNLVAPAPNLVAPAPNPVAPAPNPVAPAPNPVAPAPNPAAPAPVTPDATVNIRATEARENSAFKKRCWSSDKGGCACCATKEEHLPTYWEANDAAIIQELVESEYHKSQSISLNMKHEDINFIVIHYAATGDSNNFDAKDIHSWHTEKNPYSWNRAGYHWIINRRGGVEPLVRMNNYSNGIGKSGVSYDEIIFKRRESFNRKSIQICYMGGPTKSRDQEKGNMRKVQKESLMIILQSLLDHYPHIKYIVGHNDFKKKSCPGFDVARDILEGTSFSNYKLPEDYILALESEIYGGNVDDWADTHQNICLPAID